MLLSILNKLAASLWSTTAQQSMGYLSEAHFVGLSKYKVRDYEPFFCSVILTVDLVAVFWLGHIAHRQVHYEALLDCLCECTYSNQCQKKNESLSLCGFFCDFKIVLSSYNQPFVKIGISAHSDLGGPEPHDSAWVDAHALECADPVCAGSSLRLD